MDFEKDLEIEQDSLDQEWLRQPVLYMNYADKLAEAQRERDKAKDDLDIVRAETDSSIREAKAAAGAKVTEAVIQSEIIQSAKYKESQAEYQKAVYEVNLLSAAVKAFEHRKKALENLVQLWLASYFAGPKEPKRREQSVREEALNNAQSRQREGMQRKRNR